VLTNPKDMGDSVPGWGVDEKKEGKKQTELFNRGAKLREYREFLEGKRKWNPYFSKAREYWSSRHRRH